MLEQNSFRTFMLIGGVIITAVLVGFIFMMPIQEIDAEMRDVYERTMRVELSEDEVEDGLTMYQVVRFNLEAKVRGRVGQY